MKKNNIRTISFCAIMIALSTILSMIKVYDPPLGGSITLLSMLPICLVSIKFGIAWGLSSSFCYSLIQMFLSLGEVLSWGLTKEALIGTLLLDYILPYTLLGLAGMFRKKTRLYVVIGISCVILLRAICHYISGVIIFDIWLPDNWDNVYLYSLAYQAAYMIPELILTSISAFALYSFSAIKKALS